MEIKRTRSFLLLRMTACTLLLFLVLTDCTNKEPDFTVEGDKAITKDVKINVAVIKQDSTIMATAFYNGKRYDFDNQNALRYKIYVSYKDQFFYSIEADNLHGKIKGEPINEIVILKKKDVLTAIYRPLKESDSVGGKIMKPSHLFFANATQEEDEKRKYISLYKAK